MAAVKEVLRLQQAIEAFNDKPPRDLPNGVLESLEELSTLLKEHSPQHDSPGAYAAAEAVGLDEPPARKPGDESELSPGQREAARLSEEMLAGVPED